MLFSRKYGFVFIKTRKTASSSAELILQPLCTPPGFSTGSHGNYGTDMVVTEYGIVGARWHPGQSKKPSENAYWSHMRAADIRSRMPDLFDKSLKITCARDPISKYISAFHHFGGYSRSDALFLKKTRLTHLLKRDFGEYVKSTNLSERFMLCVKGACCVDYFIRQEAFSGDVDRLLSSLGIGESERHSLMEAAPAAKRAQAPSGPQNGHQTILTPQDYLDDSIINCIHSTMAWDYEFLGYQRHFFDDLAVSADDRQD